MVTYVLTGVVTNTDQTEQLSSIDWFKTNYATEITSARTSSVDRELRFQMSIATFVAIATTLAALDTQFSSRFTTWDIVITQ